MSFATREKIRGRICTREVKLASSKMIGIFIDTNTEEPQRDVQQADIYHQ